MANIAPLKTQAAPPSCPDDKGVQAKACPAADEFDDEDALEALVAADLEEEKKGTNAV